MDNRSNSGSDPNLQQIMQLAASPAGRQLLEAVKQQAPDLFQQAISSMSKGDMKHTKATIQQLIQDPRISNMMRDLEGGRHE